MAKPSNPLEKQTWGTWEELLLAFAVHRYGTDNWDSVAVELQKRSSSLETLTGQCCKQKYYDLNRRFCKNGADESFKIESNKDNVKITSTDIPWLEELRKLRVAELKREVERYDLSIVSLQLKVKRLEEGSEGSVREYEGEKEKSDPEKASAEEKNEGREPVAGEPATGDDSDRENRSVNESNSTDPKVESPETGQREIEKEMEPVEPASNEPVQTGEETKRGGEDSCNSVAEEPADNSEPVEPVREAGESAEIGESVAESKSGEGGEGAKESSDVQSSLSLSSKERKVDEPDNEDRRSLAIKSVSAESQPLIDFLEILRSHKLGSFFERRLETQETSDYKNLIRQHLDFETIRGRLDEGWYTGSKDKFFRDVLLLFNNAIIFFGKNSSESSAAIELRQLVSKELPHKGTTIDSLQKEQFEEPKDSVKPQALAVKPKMRVLMVACRKRRSIATKASPLFSGSDSKEEQNANAMEEKPAAESKQHDKSKYKAEENRVTKKRTRERFNLAASNSNKNSKSRTSMKTNKNSDTNANSGSSNKSRSQSENVEFKVEKEKKNNSNVGSKKKDAANFLDRMQRSSPSNNSSLLDSLKNISSENSKGTEQKRNITRSDTKKEQNSEKSTGGKRAKEQANNAKKTLGRPPRRAAAPPPPASVAPAKRGREASGAEASASGHAKKRSRR